MVTILSMVEQATTPWLEVMVTIRSMVDQVQTALMVVMVMILLMVETILVQAAGEPSWGEEATIPTLLEAVTLPSLLLTRLWSPRLQARILCSLLLITR
jgi:hypothetical protein